MASGEDKYCEEDDDYYDYDGLFDDASSEDDPPDDDGECYDRLYRCTARFKGGICCREVFEQVDEVITHLWMTHGTSKRLFQVFVLSPQSK